MYDVEIDGDTVIVTTVEGTIHRIPLPEAEILGIIEKSS
jgi:hypothetical protein